MEYYSIIDIDFDSGVDEDYYCDSLVDDSSGLAISLKGSKSLSILSVRFGFFYSYRKTNESYRLRTISGLPDGVYLILEVKSSDFLAWFNKESQGIYGEQEVFHFIVVAGDDIIDVISNGVPEVIYFSHESDPGKSLKVT